MREPIRRWGVCYYDFDAYKPKVENLKVFDTYEQAVDCYMSTIKDFVYTLVPDNIWLVWLNDNQIVQFDRIKRETKCRIVEVPKEKV